MSDPHTITDEQIRAAWEASTAGQGGQHLVHVAWLRELLEDPRHAQGIAGAVEQMRDRLGGWPAVWRAVLTDEGFEFHEQDAYQWWAMQVGALGLEVAVGEGPAGQLFLGDIDGRDLRSPADLRVRVGHARGLFAT